MEAKTVEISHVWSWFVRGWQLFTLSPWMWMGVTLLAMVITVVALVFIPGYGGVIVAFLVPTLYGGLLYGAGELENEHRLKPEYLFRGLSKEDKTFQFVMLGGLTVGVYYLLLLITLLTIRSGGGRVFTLESMITSGLPLVYLAGIVVLSIVLLYACPLVMFAGVRTATALRSNLEAFRKNPLPLLLFGAVWLGLSILAAIPIGLGFLVLLPVTICALYYSYRDIYGYVSAPGF